MIGKAVGSYTITRKLGRGGMGAVYLAEHALIGRKAAIKVLLPELSHDQEAVARLFNEARATTAIKHPGIIEVFDVGIHEDGSAYLVMEYLEGETLRSRLKRVGRMPPDRALAVTREISAALEAAHEKGVVHRDLKPDNLFLVPDPRLPGGERVKVLDFGIAKLAEGDGDGSYRTRTGVVLGTPAYMAPEQCRGAGEVDIRADFYSLGCILYHMLCGRPPFKAPGSGEVLAAHIYEPPTPPGVYCEELWPELEDLVLRLLEKKPADRYGSAAEISAALDEVASNRSAIRPLDDPSYRNEISTLDSRRDPSMPFVPGPGEATTLSSASISRGGVRERRRGGRLAAVAVTGLFAVAGIALIAVSVGGDPKGEPVAATSREAAAPADAAAAPRAEPDAAVAEPVAVPEPSPPPEPAEVTIEIRSRPRRATVYLHYDGKSFSVEGRRVGQTPYRITVPRFDGELAFRVERRRYKGKVVRISGREDGEVVVELERARRGERERADPPVLPPAAKRRDQGAKKDGDKRTGTKPGKRDSITIEDDDDILVPDFSKRPR